MEHHSGLRLYIDESENRLCDIGMITIIHEIDISIKIERTESNYHLYLKNCETKQLLVKVTVPVTTDKSNDFENCCNIIMENLDKLHNNIKKCSHCGISYGFITSKEKNKYVNVGFSDVCCDCGLQRIYNERYSDLVCSICQDPVGFGDTESSICDDHRHKIHRFCRSQLVKDSCPLCRASSDTNPEEASTRGLSYGSYSDTDSEYDLEIEVEDGEIIENDENYRILIDNNVFVRVRDREEFNETDLNQGFHM